MKSSFLILALNLILASAAQAGTYLHKSSAKNEFVGVEIAIGSDSVQQSIGQFSFDANKQGSLVDLGKRAIKAGMPVEIQTKSTGGYAPYKVAIVTLLKNSSHKVVVEMSSDLGTSAKLTVTSNLKNISEVQINVDGLPNASLAMFGPLAADFKTVLLKLNPQTINGVTSLSGTKSVYDSTSANGKSDAACGNLAGGSVESCLIYAN